MSAGIAVDLRMIFEGATVAGLTDGQLLARFTSGKAEEAEPAFAALVARHGSMVLGVCRGVLANAHDAEEAFPATFLTLARKSGSLRRPDLLGPWLHGVACHTARRLRDKDARRRRHEAAAMSRAIDPGRAEPHDPRQADREEIEVLHEEIGRLPERYRTAIILYDLQGLTHHEAGRWLRRPAGTISARLSRARERLRDRLRRRGLEPTSAAPIAGIARDAVVPPALRAATVAAARGYAGRGGGRPGEADAPGALRDAAEGGRRGRRGDGDARDRHRADRFGAGASGPRRSGADRARQPRGGLAPEVRPGAAGRTPVLPRRLGRARPLHARRPVPGHARPSGPDPRLGGRRRAHLSDDGDPVLRFNEIAVSPDGTTVASVDRQSRLQLWDLATGRELRRFEGHLASVNVVAFKPDGRSLVSGGEDGMAFVWDLSDLRGDRGTGEAADPPRPRRGKH